jgi:NAD-dependent SIR2 family protein deacetylase
MSWTAECGHTIPDHVKEWLEEQGDKSKAYTCETCGQPTIRYEPTPEEEAKVEGWMEAGHVEEGKLAKQGETSMEWAVLGKEVLCQKCAGKVKGARPFKLDSLEGVEIECAKCGAKPLAIKKGAVVVFGNRQKIYCPDCAKALESVILEKADCVIAFEEEDTVPAPLWCDGCNKPLPIPIPEEAAAILRKTIDALEEILFKKELRDARPALWQKALLLKEKLDSYLLVTNFSEPTADDNDTLKKLVEEIITKTELKKSHPNLWKRAVEALEKKQRPKNL